MENFYLSNRDVINGVVGVIYEMHPYHAPEGIDKIVDAIEAWFKEADNNRNSTYHSVKFKDTDEFYKWLKEFLKGIKEFKDYNISRKKKDQGVTDADDKRNQGFVATDRYTVETEDSRYSDFIDLDAAIRNIYGQIISLKELGDDCFLCKYAKEYGSMEPADERCATCLCNRAIQYKREPHPLSIKPKKDWTEEERRLYELD